MEKQSNGDRKLFLALAGIIGVLAAGMVFHLVGEKLGWWGKNSTMHEIVTGIQNSSVPPPAHQRNVHVGGSSQDGPTHE